jgi:itaconate CoA-transferase
MGAPAYFTAYGGTSPSRSGASHATIAPYGPFRTGDGKQVNLGIQNEREWAKFCTIVLEQPELADASHFESNSKRVANREALHAAIDAVFGNLTSEQIVTRLDQAQIANSHLNSMQEFWEHPQLEARQRWREVDSPVGMLKALRPPVTMDGVEPRMERIPELGEHTDLILETLGYTDEQIGQLRIEGAI